MTLPRLLEPRWIKIAAFTGLIFASICFAQQQRQPSNDDLLKKAVKDYLKGLRSDDQTTRYSRVFVDLEDVGANKDAFVYLSSDGWCGTGGCTLLILAPEEKSYRIVMKIPAVRLPIFLLSTKSHGWHDIGVVARISGVEPLYEGKLSFDGEGYQRDPSVSGPSNEKAQGKVVMPYTAKDKPLYK